jgi:molybdopterin adenylyltransferase
MIKTAILTISDSCSNGTREDLSGQTIIDMLPKNEFQVIQKKIIPDDLKKIANELTHFADVTPEATVSVSDKIVPGFGEIMRTEGFKKTHSAILSRGTACIRKNTLIINLPGSPKAVHESLEIMLDVLSHALEMIHGGGHE